MLSKAIGAAAVAYSIIQLVYGQADYAAVGSVDIDVSWIKTLIPGVAAVAYPLLSRFVPGWSAFSKVLGVVLKFVKPSAPGTNPLLDLLRAINDLEGQALMQSNTMLSEQCATMRNQLIAEIQKPQPVKAEVELTTAGDA